MSDNSPLPALQFDLDSIRDIAQLLRDSDLGEICLETTGDDAPVSRLRVRRESKASAPAFFAAPVGALPAASAPTSDEESAAETQSQTFDITSLAVGVFRQAKTPVKPGDEIKPRQVLGVVESLRVPNEVTSPSAGRVLEVLASDGQGVQYGDKLFVIEEM